jgi:predicted RNase H-like HicB family nuclease
MKFTVILTPDDEDGGYTAECPAIPGCISEGDTVEEALANIKEAIEVCLETLLAQHASLPRDVGVIVATVESEVPAEASPWWRDCRR